MEHYPIRIQSYIADATSRSVYFVPSNPDSPATAAKTIVQRLRAAYEPVKAGRWALEHKLLRDTPSCLPASNFPPGRQPQPRYTHFLSLSHYQSHGFVYMSNRPENDPLESLGSDGQGALSPQAATALTPAGSPMTPTQMQQSIPSPHTATKQGAPAEAQPMTMITLDPLSYSSFFAMTLRTCAPLWTQRHTVVVTSDEVYDVADFRVRIGDVRQVQPKSRLRGAIVEIEYRGPGKSSQSQIAHPDMLQDTAEYTEDLALGKQSPLDQLASDEDWEVGEALIREFWSNISVPGAREAIRIPGIGTESREAVKAVGSTPEDARGSINRIAGVDLARQYMEVLKFYR